MTNKHKIVVVGGGFAGVIASTYVKRYWGDNVEVVLVYDHRNPGIGVGESLTPKIYDYLDYVGVSTEELIKHCNATIKLGLQFKNWLNDGKYFYHGFFESDLMQNPMNYGVAYDMATSSYTDYNYNVMFGKNYYEDCKVPTKRSKSQSLHIDATITSQYILNKFRDDLTIIDYVVLDVVKKGSSEYIDYVVLEKNGNLSADFYIDASGFASVLFKHLGTNWVDRTDWLPIDSCIPNPIMYEFEKQPPYTTSEASSDGWILQVPLSNRWGAGYLYSSQFTSDDEAFSKFSTFVKDRYKSDLVNTSKVLNFKSGFWGKQWVGNCISIGLCSGFAEPLEATNIHHTVYQIGHFLQVYNFNVYDYDIVKYNNHMSKFYDNIYLYLRYCYTTGRTDSEFWKYITNSTPDEVKWLDEKSKTDILNQHSFMDNGNGTTFGHVNFTTIAWGLQKFDPATYYQALAKRNALDIAKQESFEINRIKLQNEKNTIDHKVFINMMKNI